MQFAYFLTAFIATVVVASPNAEEGQSLEARSCLPDSCNDYGVSEVPSKTISRLEDVSSYLTLTLLKCCSGGCGYWCVSINIPKCHILLKNESSNICNRTSARSSTPAKQERPKYRGPSFNNRVQRGGLGRMASFDRASAYNTATGQMLGCSFCLDRISNCEPSSTAGLRGRESTTINTLIVQ